MVRFSLLLAAAGLFALAFSEVKAGLPSRAESDDDILMSVSFDDEAFPILQKDKKTDKKDTKTDRKHYTLDKRVRGLKAGTHHVGTTNQGRQVNAHANEKGKLTGMSVKRKNGKTVHHTKVRKAKTHPTAAKRLPDKKIASLDSDIDAPIVRASMQGVVVIGFQVVFVVEVVQIVRIFWVPEVVVAPAIIAVAVPINDEGVEVDVSEQNLLLDEDVFTAMQKGKRRNYSINNRARGLTAGTHHLGTTPNGRHGNATVNKKGKVTRMSMKRKNGTTVGYKKALKRKAHPTTTRRLPNRKASLAPEREAGTVNVARQAFPFIGFMFVTPNGIWVFWLPIVLVDPGVAAGAEEETGGGDCDELEVRAADRHGPATLYAWGDRQEALTVLPGGRRSRA